MIRFLLLFLLALIGCSHVSVPDKPEPIRPADLRAFSYSTKEVQDVAWTANIYDPTGVTLKVGYTQASPGGFEGPFSWRVRGDGRVIGFKALGKATELNISDRDIVHFFVDGKSKYYGPIIRRPSPRDPNITEYEGADPFTLLNEAVIKNYSLQDVALIARDAVQAYKHPALKYDVSRFPLSGGSIQKQVGSVADLGQFLEGLAQSLGPGWSTGVDSDGFVFLRQPSGTLDLNYLTDGFDDLPVDCANIVTKSQVVVFAGEPVPRGAYIVGGAGGTYSPIPLVVTHIDAAHTTYGATRPPVAFPDQGLENTSFTVTGAFSSNFSNNANAYDSDPTTFAFAGVGNSDLDGAMQGVMGYGIDIDFENTDSTALVILEIVRSLFVSPFTGYEQALWLLPRGQRTQQRFIFPATSASIALNIANVETLARVRVFGASSNSVRVYSLRPVVVASAVAAYAQSLIKLPYITPGEVKIAPLTIAFPAFAKMDNTPGDLSLDNIPVAMYEGTLSKDEKLEVVRFGSPTGAGDEAAEAQRQLEVVQRQTRVGQQQTQALLLRR